MKTHLSTLSCYLFVYFFSLLPLLHTLQSLRCGFNNTQSKTSTTCFLDIHLGLGCYHAFLNLIRSRILLIIGILTIGIQCSNILLASIEKIESERSCTGVFISDSPYKPVICTLSFTTICKGLYSVTYKASCLASVVCTCP